jgi:hypothetical protein
MNRKLVLDPAGITMETRGRWTYATLRPPQGLEAGAPVLAQISSNLLSEERQVERATARKGGSSGSPTVVLPPAGCTAFLIALSTWDGRSEIEVASTTRSPGRSAAGW